MSCSGPRQSRDFTSPRMANRGISRQDTQPPRNQKDRAGHQGPPELFRSGSPPDCRSIGVCRRRCFFRRMGRSLRHKLREGRRTVASAFSSSQFRNPSASAAAYAASRISHWLSALRVEQFGVTSEIADERYLLTIVPSPTAARARVPCGPAPLPYAY